jgi:hypothetical protein
MARTVEEEKAAKREYNRKYRETHREQLNTYNRKYRKDYPDKRCETGRKYRETHREQRRAYEEAHRGQRRANNRRWIQEHPEQYLKVKRKYRYGISPEEQDRLFAEQGGVCAICGENRGKQTLDMDHDHITGKVGGYLCRKCNMGLGYFEHNSEWLRKATEYNEKTRG